MGSGREHLGLYRMVRLIRAGATCQVWEAVRNEKRVAIKFLQPELRASREEIAYLKHELEVGRNFHDPNVIELYDLAVDRSITYLVMEYHPGKNVKMLIRQGVDTYAYQAPKIILLAAKGLQYLHEQGWVHRDIKPDNFLVNNSGDIKLIDFALATRLRTGLGKLFGGRTKVQGTRSYISPEQIRGQALDARADIYCFGCMLYELLGGKVPFTGTSPAELLRKHLYAPVPVLEGANKNITPDFSDLVSTMMTKDRAQRPESTEEFIQLFRSLRIFRAMPKLPPGYEEMVME